ncbi:hypothetical protein MF271_17115 (plasmid) [Deinococcus sp. KNUC1210]|uniref:hypothetical protein n=1 Tax=Deinococcus sp. KNUC1210 TaxID=2917691 RepID=UPI001EF081EF|nr:hypothetical protein [Deinococcus sp. KNUC1210]ULH17044.1 hypothetical protein MF271_17115 [Deinococcus sp. KNUC1210]
MNRSHSPAAAVQEQVRGMEAGSVRLVHVHLDFAPLNGHGEGVALTNVWARLAHLGEEQIALPVGLGTQGSKVGALRKGRCLCKECFEKGSTGISGSCPGRGDPFPEGDREQIAASLTWLA